MAAAEAAARLHAMQALEQEAYTFCVKTLGKVFQYTMQAKTSTDIKYSALAALCRNDLYSILQLTMVMYFQPADGPFSALKEIDPPDISTGTISIEARRFIEYYQAKLASIRGAGVEEEEGEEEVVPRSPSPAPIRRLNLGNSPATQLSQATNATREAPNSIENRRSNRGNRSNHSRRKRRRSTSRA
jgi:hypothetical protein